MKRIKKTFILFSLLFLSFYSVPLQSITQAELERFAIKNNDSMLIDILMKYKNTPDRPALNAAMKAKDYFSVIILVECGIDINSRGKSYDKTVLEMAIESGEMSLIEYFLIKNADPTLFRASQNIPSAVADAIIENRIDVIILFAQYGIDLNKKCFLKTWSPLQLATQYNRREIVEFLISIGVEI